VRTGIEPGLKTLKISGSKFSNQEIDLDGNEFDGCTFTNCRLKFSARQPFSATKCEFLNVKWVFGGPAAATLGLIEKLIETNPDYGRSVLVSAFPQLLEWLSEDARARVLPHESHDE
jgi:hypothetical protein